MGSAKSSCFRGCGAGGSPHRVSPRDRLAGQKARRFANYRYREDLFPTSRFLAYDALAAHQPATASKQYLAILQYGGAGERDRVDESLRALADAAGAR